MTKTLNTIPPICRKLRAARLARGLSQDAVAEAIGVNRATISMLENGHTIRPSEKVRRGLERIYGFKIPRYIL